MSLSLHFTAKQVAYKLRLTEALCVKGAAVNLMKYRVVILVFMSLIASKGLSSEIPDWLIGTWKSNEELTLKSMNSTAGVTEEAKLIFSKGFFGSLIQIYTTQKGVSYLLEEKSGTAENMKFSEINLGENSVTLTYYSKIFEEEINTTLYRDESCFYILVSKWRFREYFCPYILK